MQILPGQPTPLGSTPLQDQINFSLFSEHATEAWLGIFGQTGDLLSEIPLNRTGNNWHIAIRSFPEGATYAYRLTGPNGAGFCYRSDLWLADPYSRSIDSPPDWGAPPPGGRSVRSFIAPPTRPFDWQGDTPPRIPRQDLILYEMHLRGFSASPISSVSAPGTYQGLIEKIPHLKRLGVNAIELLPLHEFDEVHAKPPSHLNYWGYSSLHFFTPMRRFAANSKEPFGPIDEFKEMVRELHRNGIEVILDVVYNHTGEGKELDYLIHFRGIDHPVYYMVDPEGRLRDYAGCGNVLNTNHPVITQLILDSLRYWVEEFHVDGFRFDLAPILTRKPDGTPDPKAPLLKAIQTDPLLSKVKLIAEIWDAAGLYLAGEFAVRNWSEWNGKYRDHVRRFIKGTNDEASHFATSLCGTEPIYAPSKTPLSSINFITVHDGFTLRDLVSYNEKHNQDNGENNRDGTDQNESWNCGIEGPTSDPTICALREKQMRNFFLALFLSQGIPMLSMRDEYGHSSQGNNNPYVHDNEINWFDWNHNRDDILEFVAQLIAFRKSHPLLRSTHFLSNKDILWHGEKPGKPNFGPESRLVAFTLLGKTPIYAAFNASNSTVQIELPAGSWSGIVQTEKPWHEQNFTHPVPLSSKQQLPPFSALLAIQP